MFVVFVLGCHRRVIWFYKHSWLILLACHSQKMEESAPRRGRVTFGWLVGLSQVLGLVSVVLTGVWMGQYKGGFAWDGSAQQFNVHPLCMVLGLVFLQGDGESKKEFKKSLSLCVCGG